MRVSRSFSSPLLALSLSCAAACASSPNPAPAAPESAAPAPSTGETAAAAPSGKPATEDETWAGEKTDKSPDGAPAEKPEAPAPDSKGTETRTREVIQKAVMDNRKAARKCYEDARRDLKDLQGDVVIHFVLDPEGKVKLAELNQERSTLKAPAVVTCVIDVIKHISFPKSSRGMETSTNYPFNFTP